IPDESKEKIFEMFYTTGHKSADRKRGMGLGLPLCRAILSAHKGTIEVLDNKPAVSIFRLTLPAKEVSLHE
ncbi:sensor histidine kinase, partial [Enterocloster bolteae]|uniref:sensor histidine kinase n=1 Tax=Enterocloster bolteae TaxID=208479 RepID=UPI00210E20E8